MDKFNPSHLFLACPNDQKELIEYQDIFECRFCHKVYKKYASNVFEFMPSNCFKIDDEKNEFIKNYNKYYHQLFNVIEK